MSNALNVLTSEESTRLLNWLRTKSNIYGDVHILIRNHAMALFMLDAGLRVGELVQLIFSDIWIESQPVKSLVVRPAISKNKTEREIPCTDRLRRTILELFEQIFSPRGLSFDTPVFHAGLGNRQITSRQVRNIISGGARFSIGRNIHPHVLRHTFATRLMRVTETRVVQKLLGHKNLGSTQIYTHPNSQDLSEAISKI